MRNALRYCGKGIGLLFVAGLVSLAGCAAPAADQASATLQAGEAGKRCPAGPEASDAAIAALLGMDIERLGKLRNERSLSNRDICEMPSKSLQRAIAKLDSPKPDHPGEWAAFRAMRRADEYGIVKPDGLIVGIQQRQAMLGARAQALSDGAIAPSMAGVSPAGWSWIGPGNVGGRIRSILIHPSQTNKIWIGSVAGGIWVSGDGGANWSPVNDFMGNLSVSSLVMDPANPNVLYAGTGEGFYNIDAVRGAGIFKSTDGGVTWSQMASTNPVSAGSQWYYVNRIAIHPSNSLIMLAATRGGIYRTSDGGASWSPVGTAAGDVGALDVQFDPNNGNNALVGWNSGVVSYSINAGATWTQVTLLGGVFFDGRVEFAYARSAPGTAYAVVGASDLCAGCSYLYKTINGGATWNYVSNPHHLGGQAWYGNAIWVDPTDANHLIVGGIDLWRSTNGGASFTQISQWYSAPFSAHADHHAIVSSPAYDGSSNRTLYFGNDGGIYKVQDIAAVGLTSGWTVLNNGLGITQFYGGAGKAAAGVGRIVGGTQDNGDLKYAGTGINWNAFRGGDGGYSAADSANDNYLYGEYVYLAIHRSADGGAHTSDIYSGITEAYANYCPAGTCLANFIAPFILDPNDNNRMLAGANSLWVSNNVKATTPSWAVIKPASVSASDNYISAISVAEGNSDIVWVGHDYFGEVYKTANGTVASPTWTRVYGLPGRMVLRILIDKSDPNRVYVALGGYSSGNLQMTTNGGLTWTDISAGLPSVPIGSITRHPNNPNWLYAGTEVGVFASENGGATWHTSNDGPANVAVDELFWYDSQRLIAATHGRGMFIASTNLPPDAPVIGTVVAGNNRAMVSFSAPASDGGSSITSYTASCAAAGHTTQSASGSGSPLVVTGLSAGVAYSCSVYATNASGSSGASSASLSVTPRRVVNLTPILMLMLD